MQNHRSSIYSRSFWNILCTLLYKLDIIQCENRIITICNERKPLMHFLLYKSSMKDWENTWIDSEDRYMTSHLKLWRHASPVWSRDETCSNPLIGEGMKMKVIILYTKTPFALITSGLHHFSIRMSAFICFCFFMVWMNDFLSFSQRKIIRILVRTLVLQVLDLKRNYDLQGSPKREFWKKKKVVHERHEKISTTWYLLEVVRMIMTAQRERRGERGIPGTFGASHVVLRLVCE